MTEAPTTKLYTALLAFQRAAGPVRKNATNPHLKSKYADLTSVLDTIEQPLWDNGLLIVQRFTHDQGGAILVTELIHAASGERIASEVPVVSKDPTDPQKIGAAITYYRRYSLLALLGLAPEDDDGHTAAQPFPTASPAGSSARTAAARSSAPTTSATSGGIEVERKADAPPTNHPANQSAPLGRTSPQAPTDLRPAAAVGAAAGTPTYKSPYSPAAPPEDKYPDLRWEGFRQWAQPLGYGSRATCETVIKRDTSGWTPGELQTALEMKGVTETQQAG